MASGVKVELNMSGVREKLSDPKVIAELEKRGKRIAEAATRNALEHYDDLGYSEHGEVEIFVSKTTKTQKQGLPEVIVFANPGIHSGPKYSPGAPIGDYAQSKHSALTKAIDAGRS